MIGVMGMTAIPGPYYFLKTRVHPSSLETECGVDLVMFFSVRSTADMLTMFCVVVVMGVVSTQLHPLSPL